MANPSMRLKDMSNNPVINFKTDEVDLKMTLPLNEMLSKGSILNGGLAKGQFFSFSGAGMSRGSMMLGLLHEKIHNTDPGTVERYLAATALFKMLGMQVSWDGTQTAPKVFWVDTECTHDMGAMIDSVLNGPRLIAKPDHERLGEHFHNRMVELAKQSAGNGKHRIQIDSLSDDV